MNFRPFALTSALVMGCFEGSNLKPLNSTDATVGGPDSYLPPPDDAAFKADAAADAAIDASPAEDVVQVKDVFDRPVIGNAPTLTAEIRQPTLPIYAGSQVDMHVVASDMEDGTPSVSYRIGSAHGSVSIDTEGNFTWRVPCALSPGAQILYIDAQDNDGNIVTYPIDLTVAAFNILPDLTPLLRNQNLCGDAPRAGFSFEADGITLDGIERDAHGNTVGSFTVGSEATPTTIRSIGHIGNRIRSLHAVGSIMIAGPDAALGTGVRLEDIAIDTTSDTALTLVRLGAPTLTNLIIRGNQTPTPMPPPPGGTALLQMEEVHDGDFSFIDVSGTSGTGISTERLLGSHFLGVTISDAATGLYISHIVSPAATLESAHFYNITGCALSVNSNPFPPLTLRLIGSPLYTNAATEGMCVPPGVVIEEAISE
ncbi:MAG: hypothetical protein IPJ69_09275 [Deltaproteobacteria bacterium]|nr:MAG: hypothetical protein IPJ69_09275 [Deltaproteobacteria bacterium]